MDNILVIVLNIAFVIALTSIELKNYSIYKQKFRLLILIPALLMLLLGTPLINYLPTGVILPIKILGCVFVVFYFFYISKITNKKKESI